MGLFFGMMLLGWGDVLKPNQGAPESIGFYANGCLSGASTLPQDGTGFQVMRPSRNRYYGQPSTLQFIQNLGKSLAVVNSGILIGDISQPRGGPMPTGHASHQIGLDVDVWFWTHPEQNTRLLTVEERETLPFVSMLGSNGLVDPTLFTEEKILKLKLAATSPGVERIFVNPAIKTYLCATIAQNKPDADSAWLHTLRPWAGHDEHFHVRLACPPDSSNSKNLCVAQAAVAAGNGCNEVYPKLMDMVDMRAFDDTTTTPPQLPVQCDAVLKAL
jgi:penicillin-insensitive murein endopeptidase